MAELERVRYWASQARVAPKMRDLWIVRAYRAGHGPTIIGQAAGLTTQRIHQIIQGRVHDG